MKQLYDLLRRQERATPLLALLNDATVFFNDDAIQQAVNGTIELEELPSLAPPYDKFFIECRLPLLADLRKVGIRTPPRVGALFVASDAADSASQQYVEAGARWTYEIRLFIENPKANIITALGKAIVILDGDGQALAFTDPNGEVGYCYFVANDMFKQVVSLNGDRAYELPQAIVDAALYTVGMLHCRNIGTDVIAPSRAEAHKFERKYGLPMVSYHVLKVTGKGSAAGTQIGAPGTGAKRPLHWARGHFKHYTEDAPLLGRAVGSFYWGAQVRGHADKGVVTKDYQVEMRP